MNVIPTVTPRSSVAAATLVAVLAVFAVGALGGLATDIGPWYFSLKQPPWKPPDTWFGPAWGLIYLCVIVAAVKGWFASPSRSSRQRLLAAWALNAVLNVMWSWLFFRLRRPDWALAQVTLLWLSILLLVLLHQRVSNSAAAWLLPYLGWVAFAAALNLAVVRLNAPFASF